MKPLYAILTALSLFIPLGAHAYDWSSRGISLQNTEQNGEEIYISLADSSGRQFGVKYFGEVSAEDADRILSLRNSFYGWKNMKPSRMDFFITGQVIEIAVFPEKYIYKNKDFMPFIPGGMLFTYAGELSYNFRITKNNVFIRIAGPYKDEDELGNKMTEAINDPLGYLKKRDPEYFLGKLTMLETKSREQQEQYEKLLSDHKALLAEHARLMNAVMTLHNTGFLGFGVSQIDQKTVVRIIEMKKAVPALKADQIRDQLEREGIKASKNEVFLVLSVYFNDFEK